jgi:hypothetical protein
MRKDRGSAGTVSRDPSGTAFAATAPAGRAHHDDRDIHWCMTYNERRQYRYFRMTQIVSNEVVIANDFFGPTLFVVGCDRIDPRRDDIESYVRRVLYLSTLPFDGIAVRPDGTCIGALGGEVGWNKMGISDAALKAQPATEQRRLDYIEQVKAHAEGQSPLLTTTLGAYGLRKLNKSSDTPKRKQTLASVALPVFSTPSEIQTSDATLQRGAAFFRFVMVDACG